MATGMELTLEDVIRIIRDCEGISDMENLLIFLHIDEF